MTMIGDSVMFWEIDSCARTVENSIDELSAEGFRPVMVNAQLFSSEDDLINKVLTALQLPTYSTNWNAILDFLIESRHLIEPSPIALVLSNSRHIWSGEGSMGAGTLIKVWLYASETLMERGLRPPVLIFSNRAAASTASHG